MNEKRIKISSIQIKNFRSIRNELIKPKDFNIFVGLNDAGKSNVLKALNLFFNGQTDYNTPFSFAKDFTYLFPSSSHSTKEIKITLKFDIPDSYTEKGEYTWTKVWRTNNYFDENIENSEGNKPNPKSRVPGALKRIKFRYVPAVKSQDYYKTLLSDLYTAVFSSIDNPLKNAVTEFSGALREYTSELSDNIQKHLDISSILTFPENLNDIFSALIFNTQHSDRDISVPLTSRGDGIQARHIPIILNYISHEDQKSRNKGSMKVWTIWGFEEPENGLELLKTYKLADEFLEYSQEIQLFVTTHSPAFYMKKNSEISQVFFVSKKVGSDETVINNEKQANYIAENMGLMPLVAPYIEEQSRKLEIAESIYKKNILTDIPTILVEGETDVDYLKIAISQHSEKLYRLIEDNKLRIVCKNDGAGTTQLVDWAIAWIFSGFKSKIFILVDKDDAGITAKSKIENSEAFKTKQNNISMRIRFIEPTNEIIDMRGKHINFEYEIEHLLSLDFWEKLKENDLVAVRSDDDMQRMFDKLVPRNKTLDNVIDELVTNIKVRDTVLSFKPKDLKKKQIVELLKTENDIKGITVGFIKTIQRLEDFFVENR